MHTHIVMLPPAPAVVWHLLVLVAISDWDEESQTRRLFFPVFFGFTSQTDAVRPIYVLPTTRREIYKRLSSTNGDRFLRHLFCICMLTIMFTDFGKMIFVCKYWWRQISDLFHDHHDCCLCWHHDQDDLKKVQRRLQRSAEARWYLGKQHLGERYQTQPSSSSWMPSTIAHDKIPN